MSFNKFGTDEREALGYGWRWLWVIVALVAILGVVGAIFHVTGEAARVADQEVGPEALVAKYRLFKQQAAALQQKQASIRVLDASLVDAQRMYGGDPTRWPRDVRDDFSVRRSEAAGLKLSYNTLAAEYNAAMADKFKRFTNVGDLPKGADAPLPREFATYLTE